MPRDRDLCEVPRAQRQSLPKPLTDYAWMHPDRNEVIAAAYASGGYKLKAIGDYFGVHYAQSRIVRRMQDAKKRSINLGQLLMTTLCRGCAPVTSGSAAWLTTRNK